MNKRKLESIKSKPTKPTEPTKPTKLIKITVPFQFSIKSVPIETTISTEEISRDFYEEFILYEIENIKDKDKDETIISNIICLMYDLSLSDDKNQELSLSDDKNQELSLSDDKNQELSLSDDKNQEFTYQDLNNKTKRYLIRELLKSYSNYYKNCKCSFCNKQGKDDDNIKENKILNISGTACCFNCRNKVERNPSHYRFITIFKKELKKLKK